MCRERAKVTTGAADTPARPVMAFDAQMHIFWGRLLERQWLRPFHKLASIGMFTSELLNLKERFTLTCLRVYLSQVKACAVQHEIRMLARPWKTRQQPSALRRETQG